VSANLSMLIGGSVVYVERALAPSCGRVVTAAGQRMPLHASAAGKALLAWLPTAQRDEMITSLTFVSHTGNTVKDPQTLRRAVEGVRQRGFAVDDEEFEYGIRCLGVPVGPPGSPVAAISLRGRTAKMTRPHLVTLAPLLFAAATSLTKSMQRWEESIAPIT
jgi:IclR family acetate operon transcriptional repressor